MEGKKIPEITIVQTGDGSSTLLNSHFNEHYHSLSGSYRESMHVYINAGLRFINQKEITVFEVGFGSGLNALLTLIEAMERGLTIHYLTIEKYPIPENLWTRFVLHKEINQYRDYFLTLHKSPWDKDVEVVNNFVIRKIQGDWTVYQLDEEIDLVYYDAFSYDSQPEMWSQDRFEMIYRQMREGGVITTYAAKGVIKNNLRSAGFLVQRLPGAPGKRHMVRAIKTQKG